MNYRIVQADMRRSDQGYVGHVRFEVEGHPDSYEMTLHSKHRRDWAYGLHFAGESGSEERISAVEEWLEEDDEAFDAFVEAAEAALER